MKKGDKVRFLSEVGGGIVSGFQGKNIVLVEDEDGFEIPMAINEVVVVGNEDMTTAKIRLHEDTDKVDTKKDSRSIKAILSDSSYDNSFDTEDDTALDYDPSDNFIAPIKEREGGDTLTAYLAFVPTNIKDLSKSYFSLYIVNDSNYYIHYLYSTNDEQQWNCRSVGEIEPNTQIYIEEYSYENINELENISFQVFAYKIDKGYNRKPIIDKQIKLNGIKFYKLNSFKENDYFETPSLLYKLSEEKEDNDILIDTAALFDKYKTEKPAHSGKKASTYRNSDIVRRYADNQSKGKAIKQRRQDDKIVVDLHIHELIESTSGLSSKEMLDCQLDKFRNVLNEYKNQKGQKIVFIHGKGEGVLRNAIIQELKYRYKSYLYQDASFQEYGFGATEVTIK